MIIRKEVFKLLVSRGMKWKEILHKTITAGRNNRQQCPFFKLGQPCRNDRAAEDGTQSCHFLHASLNPEDYDLLIEYDMLAIQLELHIQEGVDDVKAKNKNSDFDVSAFLSKKQGERYKACKWLLTDLIPKSYYTSTASERGKDFLRKLRHQERPYIRKRMIRYLECLYTEMQNGDRKDNIKVFVEIYFVNHLLNLEMKPKPNEVMRQFDYAMNRECPKNQKWRTVEWAKKLGLMVDYDDGKTYVQSIAKRFCDGYDEIKGVYNNPSEAFIKFTKFCVLLSNTGNVDILPYYNHFLLWMEYYTTVAFCLCAKVQNTPNFFFEVPESFISVVYFIDATFIQENGVPTFEAIQRHRERRPVGNIKLFHDRLEKMIGIVCGFKSKINLIQHIFKSFSTGTPIKDEAYGIAERLLVLSLVYICNLEKSVRPEIGPKLMEELCKIEVMAECPARLSKVLRQVQQANSPVDIEEALQTLLSSREGDILQLYIWDQDTKTGLQKQQLKTTKLSRKFFLEEKTFQDMNNLHYFAQSTSRTDVDEKEADEKDELDVKMTQEEKLEKDTNREEKEKREKEEESSKKITAFIRTAIFRLKAQNISQLAQKQLYQEKLNEKMKIFEAAEITDVRCGVCGVNFTEMVTCPITKIDQVTSLNTQALNISESSKILQPSNLLAFQRPGFDSEDQFQTRPSCDAQKEPLPNATNVFPETAANELYQKPIKEHEESQQHKQKITALHHFKHKYKNEISDTLENVQSFIKKHKLKTNVLEIHFKEEDYKINKFLREVRDVETKLNTIIRKCDWENAEITGAVNTMVGLYHGIKGCVEEKPKEMKERSDKHRETVQATGIVDAVENDEELSFVFEEPKEKRPNWYQKRKGR